MRGEDGGQGDGAKLQEVAWTIFGDGLAVEEKERGESRTAAREEEVPCTERQKMARAKIMRLEPGRPRCKPLCFGPGFLSDMPLSLSIIKLLPHSPPFSPSDAPISFLEQDLFTRCPSGRNPVPQPFPWLDPPHGSGINSNATSRGRLSLTTST